MFSKIVLALAFLASASAFAPVNRAMPSRTMALNAGAVETLSTLQGPPIFWGSDGVLEGKEENDIKGYDTFATFTAALAASGVDLTAGEFTVLAPTDSGCAMVDAPDLTPDVVKYHIIPGKMMAGSIGSDCPTVNGKALTYKRFARQTFLDDAVIGIVPQGAATGCAYPVDVAADNCVIHTLDRVMDPAWTKVSGDAGLGGVQ